MDRSPFDFSDQPRTWDNSHNGTYFITICTAKRKPYWGVVERGQMNLSPAGVVVRLLWEQLPQRFSYLRLGPFVVMPNHLHGILVLDKPLEHLPFNLLQMQPAVKADFSVMSYISPRAGSISTIIRSYKSAVTHYLGRLNLTHAWQERFYEYRIQDELNYRQIVEHIDFNVLHWHLDPWFRDAYLLAQSEPLQSSKNA